MLDSAFRKIKWAYTHINDFDGAVARLRETDRADFIFGKDPNTNTQFIDYNIGNPIPTDLPMILGDAVHNLRTALDHAMWELMGLDKGIQDAKTAFPFSRTKVEYETTCNGIKSPRDDTKKFFIGIEAYEGGRNQFIYGLNRLDILDKHKIITPVICVTEFTEIKIRKPNGQVHTTNFGRRCVEPNGIAGIYDGIPLDCIIECHNNAKPTIEIQFGDVEMFKGRTLPDTLIELYTSVGVVLSEMTDFIESRPT